MSHTLMPRSTSLRPNRIRGHGLARLATAAATTTALIGGALLTGGGAAGAASSDLLFITTYADLPGFLTDLGRENGVGSSAQDASTEFGNIAVTKTVAVPDTRDAGDPLTYRTTVTTTDGKPQPVDRVLAIEANGMQGYDDGSAAGAMLIPLDDFATVSYTDATGARKTEPATVTWTKWTLPGGRTVPGWELSTAGWRISAKDPVVLETHYRWVSSTPLQQVGWVRHNFDTGVALDVPGVGVVGTESIGLPIDCACIGGPVAVPPIGDLGSLGGEFDDWPDLRPLLGS